MSSSGFWRGKPSLNGSDACSTFWRTRATFCAYLFHFIRGLKTGEVVGFGNDGGDLAEDYDRLMHLLSKRPVPGFYDVPKLGLCDATLDEIITAIYRRFVLREGEAEYPTAEKREQPLQVVAEEPTNFEQEAGKDQH